MSEISRRCQVSVEGPGLVGIVEMLRHCFVVAVLL